MLKNLEETISLFPHLDGYKVREIVMDSVEEYIRLTYPTYTVTTRTAQSKDVDWRHIEAHRGLLRGFGLGVGVSNGGCKLEVRGERTSHLSGLLALVLLAGGAIWGALSMTSGAADRGVYGPGTFFFGGLLGLVGGGVVCAIVLSMIWVVMPASVRREIDHAMTEHFKMTTSAIRDIAASHPPES